MDRTGAVLVIDNFDSFTWNLVRMLEEEGAAGIDVVREDRLEPENCGRYGKILISPGPGLPSAFPRMTEVIRLWAPTCDILGICLGHQAIAEAFGGRLFRQETVRHGMIAKVTLADPTDPLFDGIPSPMDAGLYHSWAVSRDDFPTELAVTGISSDGVIMALRHREFRVRGVQFHPESIMTKAGRRLLKNWLNAT